jgi:hypothetical protein
MGMPDEPYYTIVVETYRISGAGLHGDIHVRPVKGEQFPQTLHVRSPKENHAAMTSAVGFSRPSTSLSRR